MAVMGNKGPTIVRFEEPLPVTLNVQVGSVLSLWSATGVCSWPTWTTAVEELAHAELAGISRPNAPRWMPSTPLQHSSGRCVQPAWHRAHQSAGHQCHCAARIRFSDHLAAVITVLGATGSFDTEPDGRVARPCG